MRDIKKTQQNKPLYSGSTLYTSSAYDAAGRLSSTSYAGSGISGTMSYVYDELTGLLESVTLVTGGAETILYDGLERVTKRTYTMSTGTELYSCIYSYVTPDGTTDSTTSGLVASYDVVRGTTGLASYDYTYDEMGRITSDGTYTYTYDALGQLLTVKNSSGTVVESYTYDGAGNILTATKNGTSHTYTYGNSGWRDQLTKYDGTTITYDEIGNPTSYRGWTFTWDNGRELTAASNGSTGISYTYDANGIRYSKTVGGVTRSYLYSGSTLLQEKYGTTVLNFLYDSAGQPYAIQYSTNSGSSFTTYYYITNLQGDVIGLIDGSGNRVVTYTYDSWGMLLSTTGSLASTVGAANPLRYRGYYYDTETGLYYLQTRYYDPQVGRFVSADTYTSTGQGVLGYNMFAYCLNCTVCCIDDNGTVSEGATTCIDGGYSAIIYEEDGPVIVKVLRNHIYITIDIVVFQMDDSAYPGEIIASNIEVMWSGIYNINGDMYYVTLDCNVISANHEVDDFYSGVHVYSYGELGIPSRTRIGKATLDNTGYVSLYIGDSRSGVIYTDDQFRYVCAHEFGHVLCLPDYYNTSNADKVVSVMNEFGTPVQPFDIEQLLIIWPQL